MPHFLYSIALLAQPFFFTFYSCKSSSPSFLSFHYYYTMSSKIQSPPTKASFGSDRLSPKPWFELLNSHVTSALCSSPLFWMDFISYPLTKYCPSPNHYQMAPHSSCLRHNLLPRSIWRRFTISSTPVLSRSSLFLLFASQSINSQLLVISDKFLYGHNPLQSSLFLSIKNGWSRCILLHGSTKSSIFFIGCPISHKG